MLRRVFIPIGGKKLPRRLVQLIVGETFFGIGIGLMLQSGLGLSPWDVLHQGLTVQFGLTVGIWSILSSFVVLLFWLPLRERYGIGTLLNAIIIGVMIDVTAGLVGQLSRHRPNPLSTRERRDAPRPVGKAGRRVPHSRDGAPSAHRQQPAGAGLG